MDIAKFAKVMMKTTSPNKNEVLSAIDLANSMLNSANLTWEDLIAKKTIIVQEITVVKNENQNRINFGLNDSLSKLNNITKNNIRNFVSDLNLCAGDYLVFIILVILFLAMAYSILICW